MIPTGRLLALLLACLIPFALSEAVPALRIATPLALVLVGVALVLDMTLSPAPRRLHVRRELAQRLSLGVENSVTVTIANRTNSPAQLQVRDEAPHEFRTSSVFMAGNATPGEVLRLRYAVTPPRRGDYQFGRVVVRRRGVLGLHLRQHAFPLELAVRVYPNLRDLRRYDLIVRRGLQQEAGTRQARRFGAGTEFERLREYTPDDDFRRINWKATARRGVPISAEYETERSQNVLIVLDSGRLMAAVADGLTKLDHCLNAGLLLAYAASLRGDRVALLAYSDRLITFLPPRRGRRAFLEILEQLYRLEPELSESDHARALSYLAARRIRRSLLVLFTDVIDPEPSSTLVAHLSRTATHHQVALVTVTDPALTTPAGRLPLDSQQLYEKAVAQRLLDERQQVIAALTRRGIISLDLAADRLSAQLVATYVELKARGRI